MESINVEKLYEKYSSERELNITYDQFVSFAVFFPTIQVIISDGVIDTEEWEYVKQLARFMAKSFKDEGKEDIDVDVLAKNYLKEISFLVKFLRLWQDYFIEALKEYVKIKPEVKDLILDTIQLFAEASEGTSPEEEEKIRSIKKALDIQD